MADKQLLNDEELEKVTGGTLITIYADGVVLVNGQQYTADTKVSQLLTDFPSLGKYQAVVMLAMSGATLGSLAQIAGNYAPDFAAWLVSYLLQYAKDDVQEKNIETLPEAGACLQEKQAVKYL